MWMRILVAVAVLVSGAIHLKVWFDGARDTDIIGELFMLNAVSSLVIAVLLVAWRHWIPLFLAIGFGATTLVAFVISATVGLFGVDEVWTGVEVVTAYVSEIVAVVVGLMALLREHPLGSEGKLQHRLAVRRPHLH